MYRKIFIILSVGFFILGFSQLSFSMVCAKDSGDGRHKHQLAQADTKDSQEPTPDAVTQATPVANTICPVSGEKIDEKNKVTYEYEGKIYNFCCANCIEEFKKDPEKYIKKIEEEFKTQTKQEEVQEEAVSDHKMHEGHHHQ